MAKIPDALKAALTAIDLDARDAQTCLCLWTGPEPDALNFLICAETPRERAHLVHRLREMLAVLESASGRPRFHCTNCTEGVGSELSYTTAGSCPVCKTALARIATPET